MDNSQKFLFRLFKWFEGYLANPPKKRKIRLERKKVFQANQRQLEAEIETKIGNGIIIPIVAKKKFKIKRKKK